MFKYIFVLLIGFFGTCSQVLAAEIPAFVSSFLKEDTLAVGGQYINHFDSIGEFSGHYIVPQNDRGTASHDLTTENSIDGGSAHRAWMYGANPRRAGVNTNHRAYPTFQMKKTNLGIVDTSVLVDIWVWADIDMYAQNDKSWFSIATLTSYDDKYWRRSYLINVDKDYKMHVQHVPTHAESHPDIFMTRDVEFPRAQWVRVTTYVDYTSENRFSKPIIAVWQDGQLISASSLKTRINPFTLKPEEIPECLNNWNKVSTSDAEAKCGLNFTNGLAQMHFGLYTPPLLSSGVIYNDELTVSEIIRY
jgi:hypothetical protein